MSESKDKILFGSALKLFSILADRNQESSPEMKLTKINEFCLEINFSMVVSMSNFSMSIANSVKMRDDDFDSLM